MSTSDGSTADYYELPAGATELQDLISHRNLNAQDGEIFRAIYRKGRASHSDELRDARKVLFYAQAEVKRLEKLAATPAAFGQQNMIDPADVYIASAIEDDSPRMQAIGHNDGEHYDSEWPSFAFAPPWANWVAQDKNGEWTYFEGMPAPFANGWASSSRNVVISQCRCELPGNNDWASTLTARPVK